MITIYGSSDDLIEVEGDILEEFNHTKGEPAYLSFTDGTILSIQYTGGFWRINRLVKGSAGYNKYDPVEDGYSDVAVLSGEIKAVVFGSGIALKSNE